MPAPKRRIAGTITPADRETAPCPDRKARMSFCSSGMPRAGAGRATRRGSGRLVPAVGRERGGMGGAWPCMTPAGTAIRAGSRPVRPPWNADRAGFFAGPADPKGWRGKGAVGSSFCAGFADRSSRCNWRSYRQVSQGEAVQRLLAAVVLDGQRPPRLPIETFHGGRFALAVARKSRKKDERAARMQLGRDRS